MSFIPVTLGTAGILGIVYLVLSLRVSLARRETKINTGDGAGAPAAEPLMIAMRAHANFSEYVPLILILLGGIEAAGAGRFTVRLLCLLLIIARVIHPYGMMKPAPNPYRAGGAILTWVVLLLASLDAIFRVL